MGSGWPEGVHRSPRSHPRRPSGTRTRRGGHVTGANQSRDRRRLARRGGLGELCVRPDWSGASVPRCRARARPRARATCPAPRAPDVTAAAAAVPAPDVVVDAAAVLLLTPVSDYRGGVCSGRTVTIAPASVYTPRVAASSTHTLLLGRARARVSIAIIAVSLLLLFDYCPFDDPLPRHGPKDDDRHSFRSGPSTRCAHPLRLMKRRRP